MIRDSVFRWPPERWIEAAGGEWKRAGNRWRGPCPVCGGKMETRAGGSGTLATCWAGECSQAAIAEALNPAQERRGGPRRPGWTRTRPKPARGPGNGSRANSGQFPAGSTETEAVGSPVSDERHPPRGRSTPEIGPDRAGALWARSVPVPVGSEHPARRWAARRHLWPADRAWPESVRWISHPDGGSLVAAFAPVADWTQAHPPAPTGVQLLHLDPEGRPREDPGGLSKRSHGTMTGAVCVTGAPVLRTPEALHVVEGIADALAVAAREDGAVIAAGGTAAFRKLAAALVRIGAPVAIHADGDAAGIVAARRLSAALAADGTVAGIIRYPPGCDPAEPGES